jgi:hypothetical protein
MIADKIVFLIFMPQFSSAQAASQETLGSEDAIASTRNVCAPQNESLRLGDSFESITALLCRGRTLPNIFPLNHCDYFSV